MLFRRLFLCALLAGLLAGLFDSAVQRWQVIPLVLAAEAFETAAESEAHAHADGAAHGHGPGAWMPQDGLERTAYTVLANVLNAIGSALLLLPLMVWRSRHRGGAELNSVSGASLRHGLLWGAAGWFCLFALPALGLRPELPGMQAASLQARQWWWVLTVACGAGGLAMLCLVRAKWRVLGLGLLLLPFAVGAPRPEGSPFADLGAQAAAQMALLADCFAVATAVASALQWLLLGTLCALAAARWLNPWVSPAVSSGAMARPAQ